MAQWFQLLEKGNGVSASAVCATQGWNVEVLTIVKAYLKTFTDPAVDCMVRMGDANGVD